MFDGNLQVIRMETLWYKNTLNGWKEQQLVCEMLNGLGNIDLMKPMSIPLVVYKPLEGA